MFDYNARHIIEALRSGVPSREVGEYFSESRPGMRSRIEGRLNAAREGNKSGGMIFTGRYGEGKTHMLHTAFNLALENHMVVSRVSLGKETPIDKPWELYRRLREKPRGEWAPARVPCCPGTRLVPPQTMRLRPALQTSGLMVTVRKWCGCSSRQSKALRRKCE